MSFTTPTVSDFKSQFQRDFPYAVPCFGAAALVVVAAGVIVSASVIAGGQNYSVPPDFTLLDATGVGFVASTTVAAGKVTGITVAQGGAGYSSTPIPLFSGGGGDPTARKRVRDDDILGAQLDALFNVGEGLFANQVNYSRAFNFYTAHCLVQALLAADEGVYSQYNWLTAGKNVGGVGSTFVIPERIKQDPWLSLLSTTRYGAQYLQIIAPLLVGNFAWSYRATLP